MLGTPDLTLGGLQLWVHGREFPDSSDYWDGNWLRVSAVYRAPSAQVQVDGPILRVPEVSGLLVGLAELHRALKGSATLDCIEPNLKLAFEMDHRGSIQLTTQISPDPLTQSHTFVEELDQSYLPEYIAACRAILAKFTIRGSLA